ncbi:MAG: metallopeptidase family protein [Deltaproteobacteria bacterium]|nr:metallopeptidase family protein [Deltaproteobacteria bacterium]
MTPISDEQFIAIMQEALEEIPEEFRSQIQNIDVFIEEEPSLEMIEKMNVSQCGLLGLYSGVPFTKRSPTSYGNVLPDRIYLFKKNLEKFARSPLELKEQIQRTLLHELGHYFGLDDSRLRELGF